MDGPSVKVLYQNSRKLSSFIQNYIMEGVRSPSPGIEDFNLKNIFPNMLSNTFSDFISDVGATYRRHYDR